MKEQFILVRYGELALKKRETRRRFENTLKKNITSAFANHHLDCSIETSWGRLFIHTSDVSKGITILQNIFGITSLSPVISSSSVLQELSKDLIKYLEGKIGKTDSFALRVTRTGIHDYTSQDAACVLGDDIRKHFLCSVNLSAPDIEIFIEIRDKKAYMYLERFLGPGGMPLGTQGNICAYIGCEDDVLAAWYLLRRGCSVVFFNTTPTVDMVVSRLMTGWYVPLRMYNKTSENDCLKQLQEIVTSHRCDAVCIGASFSKKQEDLIKTIRRMKKITGRPVLTPLITMTSEEIEEDKKRIGLKP